MSIVVPPRWRVIGKFKITWARGWLWSRPIKVTLPVTQRRHDRIDQWEPEWKELK